MNDQRTAAVSLVCVAIFVESVLYGTMVPLIPESAKLAGASSWQVGVFWAIYPLTYLLTGLPFGMLSDRMGRKAVLVTGSVGLALSTLAFAAAESSAWLLGSRLIQAVAAAMIWTAGLAYVADLSPVERRGEYFGRVLASMGFGFIIGPLWGGVFSRWGGRALPYYTCAIMAMAAGLGLLMHPEQPPLHPTRHSGRPRLPLRHPQFVTSCATIVGGFAGIGMLEPLLPLHWSARWHLTPTEIGSLYALLTVGYVLFQPVFGRLSDRWGRVPLIIGGAVATALCCLVIAQTSSVTGTGVVVGLLGISFGLMITPTLPLLIDVVDQQSVGQGAYGVAFGVFNVAYATGIAVGPLLGGAAYEWVGWFGTLTGYATLMLWGVVATGQYAVSQRAPEEPPTHGRHPSADRCTVGERVLPANGQHQVTVTVGEPRKHWRYSLEAFQLLGAAKTQKYARALPGAQRLWYGSRMRERGAAASRPVGGRPLKEPDRHE